MSEPSKKLWMSLHEYHAARNQHEINEYNAGYLMYKPRVQYMAGYPVEEIGDRMDREATVVVNAYKMEEYE